MLRFMSVIVLVLLTAFPVRATEALWTETDVALETQTGTLHGSFIRPMGESFDVVLIIAGSGPTDRNGNGPLVATDAYGMVARALGEAQIGSLRYDKRGIAASAAAGGREEDLRFQHFVDDALGWVDWLRAQEGVRRVFILGHSEGALVGTLAAQSGRVDGLLSVAGAGERISDGLRRQLRAGLPEGPLLDNALETIALLERGEPAPNANVMLYGVFRPSVQPYMMSWMPLDPAAEIAKLTVPVMIIQGSNDFQVLVHDAELLHAGKPDAQYVLIEGMNHTLKASEADRAAQEPTYADPTIPLHPELMGHLVGFVGGE